MATNGAQESSVSYEELIQLEYEFNDAEDELGTSQNKPEPSPFVRALLSRTMQSLKSHPQCADSTSSSVHCTRGAQNWSPKSPTSGPLSSSKHLQMLISI